MNKPEELISKQNGLVDLNQLWDLGNDPKGLFLHQPPNEYLILEADRGITGSTFILFGYFFLYNVFGRKKQTICFRFKFDNESRIWMPKDFLWLIFFFQWENI